MKIKAITILSILIAASLLSSAVYASSYNCAKAKTKAEKIVCSSPELSKLDESLSQAYQVVLKRFGKAAVSDQRWWLLRRDDCKNKTELEMLYKSRIDELINPDYTAQPRRGTGAGRKAPTYFSETPPQSIDILMEGCFNDQECARYSESLIPRYSKESNIDEKVLKETLKDCLANNSSMKVCAGFELFVLENEFADVLSDAIEPAGEHCENTMQKRQYTWENHIAAKCDREAREEACDGNVCGTIYGSIYISCTSNSFLKRIKAIRSLGVCKPCSKCLNLP